MREHRRFERYPIDIDVEVSVPGIFRKRKRRFRTRDMSDGGLFLASDGKPCPPVGTEIEVRVIGMIGGEQTPVVRARVVRVSRDGMALAFHSEKKQD